jgi:hypothetical protein
MSTSPEVILSCSICGANIYPEHFQRGLAVRQSGQIYCRHCVEERSRAGTGAAVTTNVAAPGVEGAAPAPAADRPAGSPTHAHSAPAAGEEMYRKPGHHAAGAATRMRTFHAKLSEGAILHLDQQVNSWLDTHPDIQIRFATTTVGTWEGKHPEPNLILTIFY